MVGAQPRGELHRPSLNDLARVVAAFRTIAAQQGTRFSIDLHLLVNGAFAAGRGRDAEGVICFVSQVGDRD